MTARDHTDTRKRVAHRLRIVQGHLNKVLAMVEEDSYCIDVINQSKAVQNALREVDYLLLENHLQTCVVDLVKSGKTKQAKDEIIRLFRNNE